MGSSTKGVNGNYDYSFKILLIGDSGVGKSSILLSFISNSVQDLSPTIGIISLFPHFSFKYMVLSCIFLLDLIICNRFLLNYEKVVACILVYVVVYFH